MWWCCGKSTKDAFGCKFNKHTYKDEEEENEDDFRTAHEIARLTRCMCCKELGHAIDVCPRDPNFKTKQDNESEHERISKIVDYKKGFADTVV
jgi:hypothetical protein